MDKVKENFRLALLNINKYGLAPVPEVYTVWYSYVDGGINSLREEIDSILKSNEKITFDIILEIYNRYFVSFNEDSVNKIIYDVNNLISELIGHVSENSVFFEQGSEKLSLIGEKLKTTNDKEGVKNIISTLLDDIRNIKKKEDNLSLTLKKSEKEFDNLHNELEKLKKEARIDVLTGLLNRRGFDEEMKNILENDELNTLAVIFADIDNFKSFNDNFGHLIGDEVLKYIANVFKENLKGKDIVARFGGEEFIVVIANTEFKHVVSIADNLRKAVSEKRLILKKSKKKLPEITISLGAAEWEKSEPIEKLIERADELMYMSKQNGKNRVTY